HPRRRARADVERAPQLALARAVEANDIAAPGVIERVERELHVLEPAAGQERETRQRLAVGQRAGDAALDARRRHRGGGVEALPGAVDQRLAPRVRIGLAHDHVAAARIDLAAL